MTYQKYQFTAFTEADLLQGVNGSSIGCGDTFVMPTSATVCMTTYDNDSTLSGDSYHNENANDSYGQKAIIDGARVGGQMYAESYHVLHGSDGKTYYLIEIEVEGYNAPGAGDDYFTFYGAVPPAGVSLTVSQTCNVKGEWVDFKCLDAGSKAPANTPPTFTNVPADGIICVDENTTFVIDLAASDADGDALTYEIVGGADASAFTIDPHTGELTFTAAPDYEAPTDGNGNNVYDVTVKVSDGNGGSEIKPLWIKVKDVDEGNPNGVCIVVEAEDMQLCGYTVQHNANASGGSLIKGQICDWASAKTTFTGADGQYDIKLNVLDENDGQGIIYVYVNGRDVSGPIYLDQDNGGDGINNSTFRTITLNDLDLNTGDMVTIWGYGQGGEFARVDSIEFCQDGDPMTAELGDTVWFDADKDGVQDAGEAGVAGVTVLLKDAAGATLATTTTDANGNYLFTGLAAGDYKVCVVPSNGLAFTGQDAGTDDAADSDVDATGMTGVISLAAGESNLDVDAGLVDPGTASISGTYFCDENDNDVQDAGEATLAGQTVWLIETGKGIVATTTTDAQGNYSFTGLDAGNYCVRFDGNNNGGKTFVAGNAGGDDTVDSDVVNVGGAGNGNTAKFDLAIGENKTDVDAGVEVVDTGTAEIRGRYFCDENDNDVDDGEPAIAGATVELLDASGAVIATTTTDANGDYAFTGLNAGDYAVRFAADSSGKTFVGQDAGSDDTVDSDVDGTGTTGTITVGIGEVSTDNDAGVEDPGTASLSGRVFCDDNNNDVDDNEAGVGGVSVTLLTAAGAVVASTTTAADGSYSFTGLDAGDYKVSFDESTAGGKTLVGQDAGSDDTVDSDADASGMTGTYTLNIGDNVTDVDAGVETVPGSLSGRYFCDENRDGVDNGEAGVGGVTVELLDAAGNGTGITTTTASDGSYSFGNLAPGSYGVKFTDTVSGKTLIAADQGSDDSIDSDATDLGNGMSQITGITVVAGQDTPDNDAGVEAQPGSLSGTYFCDDNDNGADDAGDTDVAGKTVTLLNVDGSPATDIDGNPVAPVQTDAQGNYSFGNLAAGDYKVMFEDSSAEGKVFIAQDAGNDDTDDSDVDPNTGMTGPVTVTAGNNTPNVDAGVVTLPGSLSGRYFCDENRDGVDNGEAGVGGVTVELLDAAGNGTGITTTTASDGSYSFGNLAPGSYGVKFTDTVSGKTLIAADQGSDDSIDSDATDLGGGMSQITGITVVAGQDTPDNDAGVETVNGDPLPAPDAGKVCVEDGGTFNVLANDTDPDGDTLSVLTIADADETVGVGGTLTLASGATATLNADGTITYDGTTGSNAGLLVGQEAAEEQITYTVSDGNGGTGSSTLDITACGSTSTLQMICDSLPAQIDLSISLTGTPLDYEITVFDGAGTADDKLASAIWNGFCIDINGTLLLDQTLTANVYTSCDPIPAGLIANPGNLDNIEWLINQDLNGASNKAGTDTYDVFDLQEAVWILSDGTASTNADANEIAQMALAMGDGFVAQDGDKVAVIFDPIAPAGSGVTDTQTFIMGVDWDAIELDCIC